MMFRWNVGIHRLWWTLPSLLIGALCLLSGCAMTVAELRHAPPTEIGYFPVDTPALCYCVFHAIEQQGYSTTLIQHLNRRDLIVAATLMVDAITRRQTAVVEVRFFAHDQATTVELRNGILGGRVMGREAWPFVKHCARVGEKPS
jgi:hypothetical protein